MEMVKREEEKSERVEGERVKNQYLKSSRKEDADEKTRRLVSSPYSVEERHEQLFA